MCIGISSAEIYECIYLLFILRKSEFLILYIVTYTTCGVVCMTNNSTWIRIGYRIYSQWRFIPAHITITSF
jgi:hypothetical protein